MIFAFPQDDLDGILSEIVAGNDGIADQILVRDVLKESYDRLKDFEACGMVFKRDETEVDTLRKGLEAGDAVETKKHLLGRESVRRDETCGMSKEHSHR